MLLLCYPRCTTCRKAKQWLDSHGIEYSERDIKVDNPTAEEIEKWHAASGLPLKKFFNTSGISYRSLGLSKKLPDMPESEQIALLSSDGMLVKRPLLVTEDKVLVGFKEAEWEAALTGNK